MNRFRIGLAALTVGAAVFAGSPVAGAAGDPVTGIQVLDQLCASKGGTVVNSPFAIARCQEARPNKGFEIEQLVCEGLLEGTFASAPSFNRPNRTTWACFPVASQPHSWGALHTV